MPEFFYRVLLDGNYMKFLEESELDSYIKEMLEHLKNGKPGTELKVVKIASADYCCCSLNE